MAEITKSHPREQDSRSTILAPGDMHPRPPKPNHPPGIPSPQSSPGPGTCGRLGSSNVPQRRPELITIGRTGSGALVLEGMRAIGGGGLEEEEGVVVEIGEFLFPA